MDKIIPPPVNLSGSADQNAVVVGDYLYVFVCNVKNTPMNIYRYSISTNTWDTLPTPTVDAYGVPVTRGLCSFAVGNDIFLYGGIYNLGSTWYTQYLIHKYDIANNSITLHMSFTQGSDCGVTVIGTNAYFVGGSTINSSGTLLPWTNNGNNTFKVDIPGKKSLGSFGSYPENTYHLKAFNNGSDIFAYGGFAMTTSPTNLYRYQNNVWSVYRSINYGAQDPAIGIISGKVFCHNGTPLRQGSTYVDQFSFDSVTGANFSAPYGFFGGPYSNVTGARSAFTDKYMFVLAGYSSSDSTFRNNTLYVYNPGLS